MYLAIARAQRCSNPVLINFTLPSAHKAVPLQP